VIVGFLGWEMKERSGAGILVVDRWLVVEGRGWVLVFRTRVIWFFFVWVRLWLEVEDCGGYAVGI